MLKISGSSDTMYFTDNKICGSFPYLRNYLLCKCSYKSFYSIFCFQNNLISEVFGSFKPFSLYGQFLTVWKRDHKENQDSKPLEFCVKMFLLVSFQSNKTEG